MLRTARLKFTDKTIKAGVFFSSHNRLTHTRTHRRGGQKINIFIYLNDYTGSLSHSTRTFSPNSAETSWRSFFSSPYLPIFIASLKLNRTGPVQWLVCAHPSLFFSRIDDPQWSIGGSKVINHYLPFNHRLLLFSYNRRASWILTMQVWRSTLLQPSLEFMKIYSSPLLIKIRLDWSRVNQVLKRQKSVSIKSRFRHFFEGVKVGRTRDVSLVGPRNSK